MYKNHLLCDCLSFCVSFVAVQHEQLLHQSWAKLYFSTRLCTKGKLKCHSISFHPSQVLRETKYCPPLFLSPSPPPPLPSSLSVLPSLAASVCLHFSLCFSYHKPPSWKKPLHKKILQQSTLRRAVPACNSVWLSLVEILSKLMHVGNKMDYQMWSKMLI